MATSATPWDPFSDPVAPMQERQCEESSRTNADWDPFADHEMLALTGDIAMQSDDADAIEAWIEQAERAKLSRSQIQPKKDRVQDLRWKQRDEGNRKVSFDRLNVAMKMQDRESLRLATAEAVKAGVHPSRIAEANRRMEELKRQEVERIKAEEARKKPAEDEEHAKITQNALQKMKKAELLPAATQRGGPLELRAEEKAAIERELREKVYCKTPPGPVGSSSAAADMLSVRLCFPSGKTEAVKVSASQNGAALLTKMLPLRQRHALPEDFAFFLPDGAALRLTESLQEQGVRDGITLRVDDAVLGQASGARGSAGYASTALVKASEARGKKDENQSKEDDLWLVLYWAIACERPAFGVMMQTLKRYRNVVVLGWNATGIESIMEQSLQAMKDLHGAHLIITGATPPKVGLEEKRSYLPFSPDARLQPGQVTEIRTHLEERGIGESFAIVVVSMAYQCMRVCYDFQHGTPGEAPPDVLWEPISIVPCPSETGDLFVEEEAIKSGMPSEDDFKRGMLVEAQLIEELCPEHFDEEGRNALRDLRKLQKTAS